MLIQKSESQSSILSKERKIIDEALKDIPHKITSFPRKKKYNMEGWGGYQIIFPIEDCMKTLQAINEFREFFSCSYKNSVCRYKTKSRNFSQKLAIHGRIDINFDIFQADAECWVVPKEQDELKYEEIKKKEDSEEEKVDLTNMTLEDAITFAERISWCYVL